MMRLWLAVFLILGVADLCPASGQQALSEGTPEVRISGLVLDRQKYSFTVQSVDRQYRVSIANGTPVLMKLTRPRIDLQQHRLGIELMLSAADGRESNNTILEYELPNPVYVSTSFASEQQKTAFLEQHVKPLDRFVLSEGPAQESSLAFTAELSEKRPDGSYFVSEAGRIHTVTLGARRGLLSGFSIVDLKPMVTSVWVQGQFDGDTLVASRIRFEHLGDARKHLQPSLPNLLSLGDLASHNYQRPLIESLAGKVNVYHPPTWTGPVKHWNRLHHYVGNLGGGRPTWDVIAFNYGIRDHAESREAWQDNLRKAIRQLQRTGAKLVWVTSTPIPQKTPEMDYAPEGLVPGRMKLQNQWAGEVLLEFPDVAVCDLWQVVESDADSVFSHWRNAGDIAFDYPQSIPLARELAKHVLRATGSADQKINPMSVHRPNDSVSSSR